MKQFNLLLLSVIAFSFSFAAPVIKVNNNNGAWRNASTWDLNRAPMDGDTVIIPAGKTVLIDNNWNIDPSRLYIKVYGTLKTASSGSKLIIGSGSTVIVYKDGVVSGAGSPSEIIKIGGNTVFEGDYPAVTGPMMANVSTMGFQSFSQSALPVKFIGFTVARQNSNVLVQWSTSEEVNAGMFELQRSTDASNWNTIAYVAATGNSSAVNNYAYTDKNSTASALYYRIRQVDVDGKFTYTPVKAIRTGTTATNLTIASVQGKILLQVSEEIKGNLVVRFIGMNGQVAEQQTISGLAGQLVLAARPAVKGNYIVSVSNGQDVNVAKQIIL